MTDTLTRDEVQAILDSSQQQIDSIYGPRVVDVECHRLATAYLALLDQHEEALGVIRELSEPAVLGASYRREWDKRIAFARAFLRSNGGNG